MIRSAIYDVECFPNFFSATFMDVKKGTVEQFVIHDQRDQRAALFAFMQRVKLLIGFNGLFYDAAMMRYFLDGYESATFSEDWMDASEVTIKLFSLSQRLISPDSYEDDEIRALRYPRSLTWREVDLMKLMAFDKLGIGLKQAAINLRWHRIQDLPLHYEALVEAEQIETILDYNLNDVQITRALFERLKPEIQLRQEISKVYGIDVTSASDSKIANLVLENFMGEHTPIAALRDLRTRRLTVQLAECIPPNLGFQAPELCKLEQTIRATTVRHFEGFRYQYTLKYAGLTFKLGIGGLHTDDAPGDFSGDEQTILRDADVSSFYPSIMLKYEIRPEHLDERFTSILRQITEDRLAAKKNGEATKAATLKITANSIFGKLGSETFWLQDQKAMLQVTIAGQLHLLRLIEMLTDAGIEVLSANTDGVLVRTGRGLESTYSEVCARWQLESGFALEMTDYARYIRRDVNNYVAIKTDGGVKTKGVFAPISDLRKGYKYPIVQKALYAYFVEGTAVEQTLHTCADIFEFGMSQKTGKQFFSELHWIDGTVEQLQKNNRFYIAKSGGTLLKRSKETGRTTALAAGYSVRLLNDVNESLSIEAYNVDYDFYQREVYKVIDAIQPVSTPTFAF